MPFGLTHMIFGWVLGKTYEYSKKIKLSVICFGFLMFGAVLPDSDFLLDWILGLSTHRTLTHSFLGAAIFFCLCLLCINVYNKIFKKNLDSKKLSVFLFVGILSHIFLDMTIGKPGVPLFFPLHTWFYFFGSVTNFTSQKFSASTSEQLMREIKFAIFDIGLGALFFFYLMIKGKIKEL